MNSDNEKLEDYAVDVRKLRGGHEAVVAKRSEIENGADTPTTEAVFSDAAIQQGMILERRDDNGAVNYRLVPRDTRLRLNDAGVFKLTLEDVETILMNSNPA